MSRLVIVSNRVADLEDGPQSGGLAVAIGDALKESGGLWFGWDGSVVEDDTASGLTLSRGETTTSATMPLTRSEYTDYYLGYSNKVLWPAFHYRLDLAAFETAFSDGYRRVNARMADSLAGLITNGDIVWVHDYHLIPMASELRSRSITSRIGFFLHIPFPSPELLAAVPDHEWLVRCLFDYDVVGFQTALDAANFQRYVEDHAGGMVGSGGQITAFGRTIIARDFPIGIDVESFRGMAQTSAADEQIQRLAKRNFGRSQIIGVDRLDYTKGLPDRLRAFQRLLELYPENRKHVTLMQIAPPTREQVAAYTDIRQELERLSGAINGAFADLDWTPVRYIHQVIARSTLAALFRGSKIGLVTPLRDGMNLVAKEYVAAQDDDDPGVLVLSRFAGAAEDLTEALIVNPYDLDDVATAMQTALIMPLGERQDRHRALLARVRQRDAKRWRTDFLDALATAGQPVDARRRDPRVLTSTNAPQSG
jgi:trehalose 6-phosphate synthase